MVTLFFPSRQTALTGKQKALGLLFLLVLSFLAFHPSLKNGYIWDDDQYVTNNDNLKSRQGLKDTWLEPTSIPQYYPLTHTFFWLEYQLWGLNPVGYHVNNVLLHALSSFLLWLILLRLKVPGAFLAAAVFAVHPVHTESVAWITERKNTLSGFFYLGSLFCYLRFSPGIAFNGASTGSPTVPEAGTSGQWRFYWAALILFVCALLSKTITATLPAVVLVIIWWQNSTVKKSDVLASIPFFVLGLGFGLTTAFLERFHVGAQGQDFAFNFIERCLIAGRALWFYMGKLVWPKDLMFIYPRWQIDASQWWQYLFPISFTALLAVLYFLKDRIGRGALAAVLIFAGTLFPALGFFNVYPHRFSFVADHFQYLASIAIIVLLISVLYRISAGIFSSRKKELAFTAIALLLVVNLGLRSAAQAFSYRDRVALWRDTVEKNPGSWMVYNNLATVLLSKQDYEGAIQAAKKAIELRDNCEPSYDIMGESYYNLRQYDEAMNYFNKLIALYKEQRGSEPSSWADVMPNAYLSMATIQMDRKQYDQAQKYILTALEIKPKFARAYRNLGTLKALQRQYGEAIASYQKAFPDMEGNPILHHDLGLALYLTGHYEQAIVHFKQALEIMPNYHAAQKRLEKAEQKWHKAGAGQVPYSSISDGK